MAQPIRIGNLDFDDIKLSLKTYLKNQTEFTDYDFEGSGISQLINVLAYNSHYDALAANFLANEMFLDTATKRSSVVSRAKELGYTPRSRRSPSTTLNLTLRNISNENTIDSIVLPKGSRFSSTVNDESFTFTTKDVVILSKQIELGAIVFKGSVVVYEGVLTQHTAQYSSVANIIKIPNTDIDTSTLKVELLEGQIWNEYYLPPVFLTISSNTPAYMIQEGFTGYEIYFGDGILGKKPVDTSSVRMTYVVTSGDAANGASNFSLVSSIQGMMSNTIVTINTTTAAGGQLEEQLESIKLNARNSFSAQNRAVTSKDYAVVAAQNFSNIKEVLAWDGSDNIPPKFGKVILCVQPTVGDVLSDAQKSAMATFLQHKGVGNVKVDFADPEYLNIEVYSTVKYDSNNLKVSIYELEFIVKSAISDYAATSIQKFSGVARYSSLLAAIDNSDYAIVGNETVLELNKILKPNLFSANNFKFSYINNIKSGSVLSTGFYDGRISNRLYLKDTDGRLHVYYSMRGKDVLYISNIGTIDYVSGDVVVTKLNIASLEGVKFKIEATSEKLDIYSSQNTILRLDQENINVTIIKDNA